MRTAEFCLPLSQLDEALGDVIETANQYADKFSQYSLLPIYVRIVKTDDLYLSPANGRCPQGGQHDHACYIEVNNDQVEERICFIASFIFYSANCSSPGAGSDTWLGGRGDPDSRPQPHPHSPSFVTTRPHCFPQNNIRLLPLLRFHFYRVHLALRSITRPLRTNCTINTKHDLTGVRTTTSPQGGSLNYTQSLNNGKKSLECSTPLEYSAMNLHITWASTRVLQIS